MLSKEEALRIRETLPMEGGPLLSLYLDINPAKPENAGRAYALRAKDALKALAVPETLRKRVLDLLENEVLEAKTLALFAAERPHGKVFLEKFLLQVELPLIQGIKTTFLDEKALRFWVDGVLAHYGEPFFLPLLYALDEYECYGVLYVDQERLRFFEVFLGEIEEIQSAFLALDTETWRRLSLDAPGRRFQQGRSSGGAGMDLFARRLEAWEERFYKEVAKGVATLAEARGFTRLVLMGPEEHVKLFRHYLPKALGERVVAELPALPHPGASPGQVLKRLESLLEEIERQGEEALLRSLEEAYPKALFGPEVLRRVQEGRVELWVLPWRMEATVFSCDGMYFASEEEARAYCGNPRLEPLALAVPGLALGYATRLEFVRGEAEKGLLARGGMAARLRW